MSVISIRMPDIGEGIAEAELVEWLVATGDLVREDQPLAAVMTDKATVEIPSPAAGRVVWLGGAVGESIAVKAELIRLDSEDGGAGDGDIEPPPPAGPSGATPGRPDVAQAEDAGPGPDHPGGRGPEGDGSSAPDPLRRAERSAGGGAAGGADPGRHAGPEHGATPDGDAGRARTGQTGLTGRATGGGDLPGADNTGPGSAAPSRPRATPPLRPEGERPLATPSVRRRAREAGVDLRFVRGSGPAGRITHDDLQAHLDAGGPPQGGAFRPRDGSVTEVRVIGLRRRIAERMALAKRQIPHITIVEEVDVTALEELRAKLNAAPSAAGRLTLLPFLACAMVRALREQPALNAHYDEEAGLIRQFGGIHLGIATQTPAGLMVPVLRHAEALGLRETAEGIARVTEAAREGRALREELSGSTITITSLGPLGALATTPIINHPEVAIVGVNRMAIRPHWDGSAFVPRRMMNLSSSFDHRVIDGWDAAVFVQRLKLLLETPALIFVEP